MSSHGILGFSRVQYNLGTHYLVTSYWLVSSVDLERIWTVIVFKVPSAALEHSLWHGWIHVEYNYGYGMFFMWNNYVHIWLWHVMNRKN